MTLPLEEAATIHPCKIPHIRIDKLSALTGIPEPTLREWVDQGMRFVIHRCKIWVRLDVLADWVRPQAVTDPLAAHALEKLNATLLELNHDDLNHDRVP